MAAEVDISPLRFTQLECTGIHSTIADDPHIDLKVTVLELLIKKENFTAVSLAFFLIAEVLQS